MAPHLDTVLPASLTLAVRWVVIADGTARIEASYDANLSYWERVAAAVAGDIDDLAAHEVS